MKKSRWVMLGVLAVLLLGSAPEVRAQEQASAVRGETVRGVEAVSGTVLESGRYALMSLVGQSIAGGVASRSGGIWRLQRERAAARSGGPLELSEGVPSTYALEANYPNPFNPETVIGYAVPEAGRVVLAVYDVLGREVARLVDGEAAAGRHTVVFRGGGLASGVYVYRLVAGSFEQHRTMMLVK